ncbi:hypothetical protein L195_g020393, partial [Trifolium pratense]
SWNSPNTTAAVSSITFAVTSECEIGYNFELVTDNRPNKVLTNLQAVSAAEDNDESANVYTSNSPSFTACFITNINN